MQNLGSNKFVVAGQPHGPSTKMIHWLLTALRPHGENYKDILLSCLPEIDWAALISYTDQHGLTPLLCHQFQQDLVVWSAFPQPIQEVLQQRYLASAQRNLIMYSQFLKVVKMLNQSNIPVILLKGAYLAHVVYRDRALRPMTDVDILIKQYDLPRVESILKSLGYSLNEVKHRDWSLQSHYHLSYFHPQFHVQIEVHWHIQRPRAPYSVDINELWRNAHRITIAGVDTLGLSHEHLLLHQCLHLAKHGFGVGLRPFCDIAETLTCYQEQMDWELVRREADRWRIVKALRLSLLFTHEFFDGVPPSVIDLFNPVTVESGMLETARGQVLTFGATTQRLSSEFLQVWDGNQGQGQVSNVLQRVFLPRDLMARVYHLSPKSWRIYLYYPVRIFDLFARYPRMIRQLMSRDETIVTMSQQTKQIDAFRDWLAT